MGIVLVVGVLGTASHRYTTTVIAENGGVFREGMTGAPHYLNPLLSAFNQTDQDLTPLIFDGLVKVDVRGVYHPDLAKKWWIDTTGMTYTVALRPDVRWHDGQLFTADDVLYTIQVMQSPNFPGLPSLHDFWSNVRVKKITDYVVQFRLAEPLSSFLDALTIGILPAHLWKNIPVDVLDKSDLNLNPVGTGPFKFQALYRDHLALVPNPFQHGGQPYLQSVDFYFYPNPFAMLNAYQKGNLDGMSDIPPDLLPEAKQLDDLQLFFGARPAYVAILLNLQNADVPYLQDVRVRRALLMAIDRQKLIDKVLNGAGVIAETPFLPDSWAYTNDIHHYTYDPGAAKQLLTAAGWQRQGDSFRSKAGKPLTLTLYCDDRSVHIALGQAIVQAWRAIGVDAQLKTASFADIVNDQLRPHKFQAALVRWDLHGDPDPYPLWHSTQMEHGQNYGGWQNRHADEAMEQGRRAITMTDRITAYHAFQQIFADQVPALLLYASMFTCGVRDNIHGVRMGSVTRPADCFRYFSAWYIAEKRVPVYPAADQP